jgi:hypothetical protein
VHELVVCWRGTVALSECLRPLSQSVVCVVVVVVVAVFAAAAALVPAAAAEHIFAVPGGLVWRREVQESWPSSV